MENAILNEQRSEPRPPSRFTETGDLQAEVIGETAYVYGGVAGEDQPYALSGVLNETTSTGCSIVMPQRNAPAFDVGTEVLIKVRDKGSWAVLCWRQEFGGSTHKLGFRYL